MKITRRRGELPEERREVFQPLRDGVLHIPLALPLAVHREQARAQHLGPLLLSSGLLTMTCTLPVLSSRLMNTVPLAVSGCWRTVTIPA